MQKKVDVERNWGRGEENDRVKETGVSGGGKREMHGRKYLK